MTPQQRKAALRLSDEVLAKRDLHWHLMTTALLRELVQEQRVMTKPAGASPVDQPVGRPCPKRYEGGRIKGGCSLHDAEKPELCQKHLHRCPEPRTVDCCGVVDEHDIVECHRCGRQWTVPCNFDEDYS